MIAHPTGWGLFAIIATFIALVVLGRAIEPLLKAVGLVVGLAGAVVGLIAAALALCAVIVGVLASSAGWNQLSGPLDDPQPLHYAMMGLGAALGVALLVAAWFARRLWDKKRD